MKASTVYNKKQLQCLTLQETLPSVTCFSVNRDKHNDHPFWMILGMIGLHKSSKTSETFVKIHDILL